MWRRWRGARGPATPRWGTATRLNRRFTDPCSGHLSTDRLPIFGGTTSWGELGSPPRGDQPGVDIRAGRMVAIRRQNHFGPPFLHDCFWDGDDDRVARLQSLWISCSSNWRGEATRASNKPSSDHKSDQSIGIRFAASASRETHSAIRSAYCGGSEQTREMTELY